MRNAPIFSLMLAAALIAGCAPKAVKTDDADNAARSKKSSGDYKPNPGVDAEEASLRGGEFQALEGLETIYFEYDSSTLKDEALAALKKNAAYLKENKQFDVRVAGYCDERGTVEYNLALGQKRAKSVREYYIRLGVNAKQVATISYGKEALVCSESSEDCWQKNRRAETQVRARVAQNAPAADPLP
jgi:peptidoglycan-associated lipoprotein